VRAYVVPTGRRYERRSTSIPVTLITRSNDNESGCHCNIVETSERGLRLRVSTPLSAGQNVLLLAGEASKYAVQGRVVWTQKSGWGEEWVAGVEVLDSFCP
jgi:hypothetical protein